MIPPAACWTCSALIPDPATAPRCPVCHAVFCSPGHASIHGRAVQEDTEDDVVSDVLAVYNASRMPG